MQWRLVGSQASGEVQPVCEQPGTQAPPEQMLAGAPTHSKSELQPCRAGGRSGRSLPEQQCPVTGLQRNPSVQVSDTVQPATQVWVEVRHTRSGGSQSPSTVQDRSAGPPKHSPLAGLQVAPPTQLSAVQPGMQRPSA